MIIDNKVLQRCVENDQRAIKQLYEYCYHKLMPLCVRYHSNQEDARSSLNLAFVKIIKTLPKVNIEELTFNAWAARITTNTLVDEYRKRKLQEDHYIKKETERELDVCSESSNNEGLENLNYEFLLQLVQKLPEVTKIVFNLFVIEGYTHNEIAEMLEMPLGTSKWHISAARKLLKEYLEKVEFKTHNNELVG